MKGTYKPPHTYPINKNTHSTTSKLDFVDEKLKKNQDYIARFNAKLHMKLDEKKLDKKLDKNLDENLNNFKQIFIESLMGMPTEGILEENH
jgi:hypothetical protein